MITLYAFGPAFGLPDPSPFVTKAEVLLKMAGLSYRTDTTGFRKAPKGKLPYIDDDGHRVADSTFIRWHLENKYQIDFDKGLSAEQRAIAWAFEKMAEDNLYWALVDARWFDEENFAKGPLEFFRKIPAPMRPLIVGFVRRQLKRTLYGQGMGRHTRDEMIAIGTRFDCRDCGFSRRQTVLYGQRAHRRRCNDLCVCGQHFVPAIRYAAAHCGREARESAALCRPHGGPLLPRVERNRGLQSSGVGLDVIRPPYRREPQTLPGSSGLFPSPS